MASRILMLFGCFGAVLPAQVASLREPSPWWWPLPDAAATAIAVVVERGTADDPPDAVGLSLLLAECRLHAARRAVPAATALGRLVTADLTIVYGVVPAEPAPAAAFAAALRQAEPPPDDAALALSTARLALQADDAEFVYPGPALQAWALQHLLGGVPHGRPPAGRAAALAGLAPAVVREALRQPVAVHLAAFGGLPAAVREQLAAPPFANAPLRPPRGWAAVPAGDVAAAPPRVLPRTDAPFVAAAIPLPADLPMPALALYSEVVRGRAQRRMPRRGSEAFARAPHLLWQPGEPLWLCLRRGADPVDLLPGERPAATAEDAAASAQAELQQLLAAGGPPDAEERAAAEQALLLPFRDPAPSPDVGAVLAVRLAQRLAALHHGIGPSTLPDDAELALVARWLGKAEPHWFRFLPAEVPGRGFLRR